jgi:photosystem II stability/assembly factor-like uncharacterized protein
MKKYFLLHFFLIFFINTSSAQWQNVFNNPDFEFSDVYFINSDTGFACGYHYPSSWPGSVLRTLDGGITWDITDLGFYPVSIRFVDDSTGFAGGQDGFIYKTTDMGNTWTFLSNTLPMSDLSSIYFINSQKGFCSFFDGHIWETTDGGITWPNRFTTAGRSYFPGTAKFFFTDSLIGYSTESYYYLTAYRGSAIAKTIDGGTTWSDLPIPTDFFPYSTFFFDSINGFAVGYHGKVSKTTNGGLTWSTPDSVSRYPLYDIAFVTDSIGYITGGNNEYETFTSTNNRGIILKTIDRGNTWTVMDSSYTNGLTKVYFPNDSIGYTVGLCGKVLKLTHANSMFTSVSEININPNNLTFSPNPATSTLTISSESDKIKDIHIYSVLGEVIRNYELGIRNGSTTINVSTLTNGMYFIEATTDKGIVRKKFIKQ